MIRTLHKDPTNNQNKLLHSSFNELFKEGNHEGVSVKYVNNEKEDYFLDNYFFEVKKKEYLLVDNHSPYKVEFDSKTPVEGYCFYLDKSIFNQIESNPFDDSEEEISIFQDKFKANENETGKYLESLISKINKPGFFLDSSLYYELAEKIYYDQRKHKNSYDKIKAAKTSTKHEIYRRVRQSIDYINDNITKQFHIKDVALNCGLSEFHFFRSFKSVYGITPQTYIMSRKLDYSKKLLINDGLTIQKAAETLGFTDSSHFSKSFKTFVGQSPNNYKKNQLSINQGLTV